MAVFRSKSLKPSFDPAFDDLDLIGARDGLAQGRWEPARDLLEDTRDWDRRSHRIRVLAEAAAGGAAVERWQSLDPWNPDAAALRAQVEVLRLLRERTQGAADGAVKAPREVEEYCSRAISLAPQDPVPRISLISLARVQGVTRNEFWRRWQEMRRLDPWNRDGNHQTLMYLFAAWRGSTAEMYDFAYWLAAEVPEGSPLAVLPLVAHAEAYRARAADPRPENRAGLDLHWTGPQIRADLDQVLGKWFTRPAVRHAQMMADANYLAHALIHADRHADAREVMRVIGPHATRLPWNYTGDPAAGFAYWRKRLLGA